MLNWFRRIWHCFWMPDDPCMRIMEKGFRQRKSDHAIMVMCREAGFQGVTALHVLYYRKQWIRGDL